MSAAGGEVEVGVPNSMVGMLIGKEGASLAALRKESGTRIKTTPYPYPYPLPLTLALTLALTLTLSPSPNPNPNPNANAPRRPGDS